MHRKVLSLLLLICPALPSIASGASPRGVEVENVRVGFGESFKIGAWTPVWVQARAGVEAFDGTMEVIVPDESLTPVAFSARATIAAGESGRFIAYVRPGSNSGDLTVRFTDRSGAVKAVADLEKLRPNNPPSVIFSDDIALLSLGKAQGVELVPKLPGYNGGRATSNANGSTGMNVVEVIRADSLDGGLLPGRAWGYDAFDAVVVDTNDKALMASIAVQGEAMKQWVAQGGHLVVAVGANWQAVRDSVLAPILPAVPAGTTQINDIKTVETFAGATTPIIPVSGERRTVLTVARLQDVDARGGKILCGATSFPIVVRGTYGFGRVTLVGLDVDQPPFADWADRGLFWVKSLDIRASSSTASANQARARFMQFGNADLSSKLRVALEQFPGVKLVPFGWVAFFIFLYIVLIGPGDYFLLRRVFKRMELTWITFPIIVVAVSAGAYYAAYRLKGDELRVNQVEMVDVDIPSKLIRGASFVNVFSPQNKDYDVAIVPRSVRGDGPLPGVEPRISWFAAPEVGLRGMNGGGQSIGFGSAGYSYAPEGRADSLKGVRIPIWSTKAFTARWFGAIDGEPIIESDLEPNGLDRLVGTITNRLDVPIKRAALAFNTQVYYNLGEIAPGQTVRIELTLNRNLAGLLHDNLKAYAPDADRTDLLSTPTSRFALAQSILFRDSDTSANAPFPSRPLHDLDLTGQLLLDRPMLVGEVDRALSDVELGGVAHRGKSVRTTLLRVILPLKK